MKRKGGMKKEFFKFYFFESLFYLEHRKNLIGQFMSIAKNYL